MDEELLRKNLTLIRDVARRADVEIILAFKSFAMWRSFPIFREYIDHSTYDRQGLELYSKVLL